MEELKHLAELEELDRYHPENDNDVDNDDDDEHKMKKKEGVNGGVVTNSGPDGSGDVTKSEEGGRT